MMVRKAFFGLAVLGFMASPLIFAGPQLVSDMAAGPNWTPALDLRTTAAHCTRWYGVVSTCSIQYAEAAPNSITPELHYFVYGSWGGERALLLRSTAKPSAVTTSQAVRDLGARKGTLAIWLLVCGFAVFSLLAAALKASAARTIGDGPIAPEAPAPRPLPQAPLAPPGFAGAAPRTFGRRTA